MYDHDSGGHCGAWNHFTIKLSRISLAENTVFAFELFAVICQVFTVFYSILLLKAGMESSKH